MAFDATYDACVLHPAGLRDLLIRLATTGMFRAHWSDHILDEMVRSILRRRPPDVVSGRVTVSTYFPSSQTMPRQYPVDTVRHLPPNPKDTAVDGRQAIWTAS